jgi:hypothetical protein
MSTDPAELGYVFSPFADLFSLGYAQLDVFLGQPGTAEGFVPSQLIVCTWDNGGVLTYRRGIELGPSFVSNLARSAAY